MDVGSAIEWMVGAPIVVLALAISLWWVLGHKDGWVCSQCSAPKIFGDGCIVCGDISMDSND